MSKIWFLTYEAAPDPGSDDFGSCGGAFINCWIVAESQSSAESLAVCQITDLGWSIIGLEEAELVDTVRFAYSHESIEFIEQAKIDGAVFCFHRWPPGLPD